MSEQVRVGELELSRVQKLTSLARHVVAGPNSVRPEGEYFVALEPNAFGLPAIDSCPGRTDYCEQDCYGIDSEGRPATRLKLERNFDVLKQAETVEGMTEELRLLMSDYVAQADKIGIAEDARYFRIHWDGDFFSLDYAKAWRTVIEEHPSIRFWAYTRSFQPEVNVVPVLAGTENLHLFLSVDFQNVDQAAKVIAENPDERIAYLTDFSEEAKPLREKLGRTEGFRAPPCPENMKDTNNKRRLPVVSEKGGACQICKHCMDRPSNRDVTFVKTGKRLRSQGQSQMEFDEPVPVEIRKPRSQKVEDQAPFAGTLALTYAAPVLF